MKKYLILCILFLMAVVSFCDNEPTGIQTPKGELTIHYSNVFHSFYTGRDVAEYGGFFDSGLIYSPTDDISNAIAYDNFMGGAVDGIFFENAEYEQLFMGTLIISENGGAYSGGIKYNSFNRVPFCPITLNQDPDIWVFGIQNPTFEGVGFGELFYLDRHFEPEYNIIATLESECNVSGNDLHIVQKTFQYPTNNWDDVATFSGAMTVTGSISADVENIVIKNFTITNNSSEDREIYVSQRLDGAVNTTWNLEKSELLTSVPGNYKIHYYFSSNYGEINDRAGYQEPISGVIDHGYFGYLYDETAGFPSGLGVKIMGNNPNPASFKIVSYKPGDSYITGAPDNRLVKYGIEYLDAFTTYNPDDPNGISSFTLKPFNPMEYSSSSSYYNDFVAPGEIDDNTTVEDNYAICITAGPFEIDAGETINVGFAIAAAAGTDLSTFKKNLDRRLDEANSKWKSLNGMDISPSPKPHISTIYEKYDVSDGGVNIHVVWDNIDFGAGNDSVPAGCGYNLYYSTWAGLSEPGPTIKYKRMRTNEVTRLCGPMKNAPTDYIAYTDDNFIVPAEQFKSEMDGTAFINYAFALSSHDNAWWDSGASAPQLESEYFNESMPDYYEFYLVPAAIDLEGEFAYDDNSNIFALSWSSPASRERDLKKYELYRSSDLVESIYLQAGVYEYIEANTDSDMIAIIDDADYYLSTSDAKFDLSNPVNEVVLTVNGFNAHNKVIIDNFYLQYIEGVSPFVLSDSPPVQYKLISEYSVTSKEVYWDSPTSMLWWEKTDDWGDIYYLSETGTTKTAMCETESYTISGMYLVGDPETIIDYSDTPLAGDSSYQYEVWKYDFLTPLGDIAKSDSFILNSSPDYPTNLVAEDTNKSITLTFNKASGDIFRYYVYRCSTAAIYDSVEPLDEDYIEKIGAVASTGADTYTFVDTYIDEYATYYYFVTSFNRTTDLESQPSNIATVSKDFDKEQDLELAHCVPNPFIYGTADALQENNHMVFVQLTENATITIYDIKGGLIRAIEHSATSATTYGDGGEKWDLMNEDGKAIATGLYFYVITNPDDDEDVKKGKLVIVR